MAMPTLKNVPNYTEKLQYKVNGTTMVTKGAFSGLVCSNAASKCRNKGMNEWYHDCGGCQGERFQSELPAKVEQLRDRDTNVI